MRPIFTMFLEPSLEATEENQLHSFALYSAPSSVTQSIRHFIYSFGSKVLFPKTKSTRNKGCVNVDIPCGVPSGQRRTASGGQRSLSCVHLIYEKQVPLAMQRFSKRGTLALQGLTVQKRQPWCPEKKWIQRQQTETIKSMGRIFVLNVK